MILNVPAVKLAPRTRQHNHHRPLATVASWAAPSSEEILEEKNVPAKQTVQSLVLVAGCAIGSTEITDRTDAILNPKK